MSRSTSPPQARPFSPLLPYPAPPAPPAAAHPRRSRRGRSPGRLCLAVLALAGGLALGGEAQAVGVGVLAGSREPDLALTLKSGLGSTASDLAFSWGDGVYLHADYLVHLFFIGRNLPFYVGVGGLLRLDEQTRVGLRVPLGVSLILARLELFFEVVPQVTLYPDLVRDWSPTNLGLGIRLHF